jgi:cell wall-associated NlpC family hydrolase
VIAAALRFQGYTYQHYHIPDWEPAGGAKGVDCSNFTAFVYNQALGLKPSGGIKEQAEMTEVEGPGPNRKTKALRIDKPSDHSEYERLLKTGDLLFIRGKVGGDITHVVLWVGSIGQSQNHVPLIIDSTGEGRKDETGATIPDGVQLRSFGKGSWYSRCAAHAIRLISP